MPRRPSVGEQKSNMGSPDEGRVTRPNEEADRTSVLAVSLKWRGSLGPASPVQVLGRKQGRKRDGSRQVPEYPGSKCLRNVLAVSVRESDDRAWLARIAQHRSMTDVGLEKLRVSSYCRVAPGDCSPEALTRTGLGGFHHPALPLMWLMAMRPRFARESEARAEDIVPTTQRTSAR